MGYAFILLEIFDGLDSDELVSLGIQCLVDNPIAAFADLALKFEPLKGKH